jgi:hypothetical protein
VHPAADAAGDLLCDDEVDVIGHHAGCQERERVSSLRLSDQSNEGVVIARVFEEPRAVIAATDDVIVATGDQGSGSSRHAPSMWSGTRFRTSRKSRESTVKQPLKGDAPENRRMSPIFRK